MRGKTGRNPLDPINREKRIHENPSHVNLTPDFIGSISKNRVFQRELIKLRDDQLRVNRNQIGGKKRRIQDLFDNPETVDWPLFDG